MNKATWLTVCGVSSPELAEQLSQRVAGKIAAGEFTADFVKVVGKMEPGVLKSSLQASESELEALRRLCQIWDVDLKQPRITSHRPIIGPLIVGLKRILFPILRMFMRDTLRQQRDFNAQTIALLMQLCQGRQKSD